MCNIWRDTSDRSAPALHQADYSSDEVQVGRTYADGGKGKSAIPHVSPGTYSWQNKVAEEIFAMTGVRIRQSSYTLR